MDTVSYLLGKNSAGGKEPKLQTKALTITTNTTTNVEADEGYDGLGSVSVTTNIPIPTAPQITNGSYLFYDGARRDQYSELMSCITSLTDCRYMFYNLGTPSFSNVDLSNGELNAINTPTAFDHMFFGSMVVSVKLSSVVSGITTFQNMFTNATTLVTADLSGLNGTNINSATGCNGMFSGCSSLETVKMPNGIFSDPSKINCFNSLFYNCMNLQTIDNNTVQYFIEHFPLNSIPDFIFTGNSGHQMTNVTFKTLPDTLTGLIKYGAFSYCPNITQFSANKITGILGTSSTNGAFWNCSGLKAVWLGDTVTSSNMGRYAFYKCTNLQKIYINLPRATVQSFSYYQVAFMNDTSKNGIIICNDDPDWIDKTTFDATTW